MDVTWQAGTSTVRPASQYDPMTSWDGRTEDPTPFARFASEKRVISLEGHPNANILGTVPAQRGALPRTEAMEDADGDHTEYGGGAGGRPEDLVDHSQRAENALVLPNQEFRLNGVNAPRTVAVRAPLSMKKQGLLTPAERREIMEFEKLSLQAKRTRHKSDLEDKRRVQIMRARHPEGLTGVDGPTAQGSDVYAGKAHEIMQSQNLREQHIHGRAQQLGRLQSSVFAQPYGLLNHDHEIKGARETKVFQAKGGTRQYLDTHSRLFQDPPVVYNPGRARTIRAEDLGGKNFNIVSGQRVNVARTGASEKQMNAGHLNREAHPSIMNSKLERFNQYKPIANATGL
jgi:hypothetical protein